MRGCISAILLVLVFVGCGMPCATPTRSLHYGFGEVRALDADSMPFLSEWRFCRLEFGAAPSEINFGKNTPAVRMPRVLVRLPDSSMKYLDALTLTDADQLGARLESDHGVVRYNGSPALLFVERRLVYLLHQEDVNRRSLPHLRPGGGVRPQQPRLQYCSAPERCFTVPLSEEQVIEVFGRPKKSRDGSRFARLRGSLKPPAAFAAEL